MNHGIQDELLKIQAAASLKEKECEDLRCQLEQLRRENRQVASVLLPAALAELEVLKKATELNYNASAEEASATAQLASCTLKLSHLQARYDVLKREHVQALEAAASKQELQAKLNDALAAAESQRQHFCKQLEDLANTHHAKIQDLRSDCQDQMNRATSIIEAQHKNYCVQMERLSSSHQAYILRLQAQFQSEIHTKETAANAALQAKRKAEYDLARERTMWQAALSSMNESQAREEGLKARVMALRSEINALKCRRGGLGA